MRSSPRRLHSVRTSRFETFEPRLVTSTNLGLDPAYFVEPLAGEVQRSTTGGSDLFGLAQAQSAYGFNGSGQTVVVIDSGIAYTHTALGGGYGTGYRVVGGYDFAERDDNPYDDGPFGAHGTHVAGIMASSDSQYPGIASGADLVSLRVFDDAGHGEFAWVEEALRWVHEHVNAFDHPITTVNLSLGSSWNSTELPSWASLEEELAQLEADGIFIAVAAGNSFTSYNQPGLSYPAASPHVVPVSSVDNDGQLSYYSQRDGRAIAAPGRSIMSTVPDYLGNGNGVDDDYAAFSGTSMAAPYVAAASVLLRQAYEFVGVSNINQERLYNLMCSTADTLYDSATGQSYLRLNLGRALDTIMPADDFGSVAAAAHSLGTVQGRQTFSGTIERLDDRDYFRFTAGDSGTVRLALDTTGQLQGQWELVGSDGTASSDGASFTFRVVAGQTYTFALGTQSGVGHYSVAISLNSGPAQPDHAPGGQQEILDQSIDASGKWFTLSAVNTGIFTIQAMFRNSAGDVDLELFDAQGNCLGGSYGTGNHERIDVSVTAGQTLYAHAYLSDPGVNGDVDLKMTNLVSQAGSTVSVLGTDGDDAFQFTAGAIHRLSINGVQYDFGSDTVSKIEFNGFGGSDTAVLEGTSGNEIARLRPGKADVQGPGYRVQVSSVESSTFRGGGGADLAALYDSAGDDVFEGRPGAATLSGHGFSLRAEGVAVARAVALLGGTDVAYLYDSSGDDTLLVLPGYSRLAGNGFTLVAKGYESVHAFSTAGGRDAASFVDSAGDDTFLGDPRVTRFWTGGYYVDATQFERAVVSATAGGRDAATLYGSDDKDTLISKRQETSISGEGFSVRVKYFEEVHLWADGGTNQAYVDDWAADDHIQASANQLRLSNQDYAVWMYGLERVSARARAGSMETAEAGVMDCVLEVVRDWR